MPAPFWVSHTDSMAANLVGWVLAISTAWKSPEPKTSNAETKLKTDPILKDRTKKSTRLLRSRCHAEIPITKKAATM